MTTSHLTRRLSCVLKSQVLTFKVIVFNTFYGGNLKQNLANPVSNSPFSKWHAATLMSFFRFQALNSEHMLHFSWFSGSGPINPQYMLDFWLWTHDFLTHAGLKPMPLNPWIPNTNWISDFEPMNPQHKLVFLFWTHESPAQTRFLVLNPWIPNTYWTSGFEPTNLQHTLNLNWMLFLKLKTVSTEENTHC